MAMSQLKALVVEDDQRIMPTIEDALYSMGHQSVHVTNQEDAQQHLDDDKFDYVLLDLHIPTRPHRGGATIDCGANLLRWIRKERQFEVPVIIMTGYSQECLSLAKELLSDGADDFIPKPFQDHGRTLGSVIRHALGFGEPAPRLRTGGELEQPSGQASSDGDESDRDDDAAIDALPERELAILEAMASNAHQTMLITDIVTAGGYSKTATKDALGRLEELGLVGRPPGTKRKGMAMTRAGREFLQRAGIELPDAT